MYRQALSQASSSVCRRVARREGFDRSFVNVSILQLRVVLGLRRIGHRSGHSVRFPVEKLTQHVLKDAPVNVVEYFLGRIDPDVRLKLDGCSILPPCGDGNTPFVAETFRYPL